MVFNIVYTAAPIVALAVFDKDVPDHVAERNEPDMYCRSKNDMDFNLIVRCECPTVCLVVLVDGSRLLLSCASATKLRLCEVPCCLL